MADFVGPMKMNCQEHCEVPDGMTMTPVPRPRHKWSDIIICPNEGCGAAFLVHPTKTSPKASDDNG